MTPTHLDTDFLVVALSSRGPEFSALMDLAASAAPLSMSAIAWYEFSRGPRTPEQLARAEVFLGDAGVIPFTVDLASMAGDIFRSLGSPRRRANDVAIAVTAIASGAQLWTRNASDFSDIPGLDLHVAQASS